MNDHPKYVVTKDGEMIIFSPLLNHSQFKGLEPVSAGFISFGTDWHSNRHGITVQCYGESVTLDIKSRMEKDELIAMKQLNLES